MEKETNNKFIFKIHNNIALMVIEYEEKQFVLK